ncbi:MAG TPA: sulfurtransferase-like selenium metabolism protein YedF [Firmicutes bacterium]|nr:sulfurtransferase-like selenium metabolism protein YedF [Bacillota bacterium]
MEEKRVDARGLACPLPVIRTKKAIEALTAGKVVTIVDNPVARDNVAKLARSLNLPVAVAVEGNNFVLTITKEGALVEPAPGPETAAVAQAERSGRGTVVLVLSDAVGRPAEELGHILTKSFFYTLTESTPAPAAVILMNGGVRLSTEGSEVLASLKTLEKQGVEILSCGTCLDYLKLKDKLAVGNISNMFTIVEKLLGAEKVVTIS